MRKRTLLTPPCYTPTTDCCALVCAVLALPGATGNTTAATTNLLPTILSSLPTIAAVITDPFISPALANSICPMSNNTDPEAPASVYNSIDSGSPPGILQLVLLFRLTFYPHIHPTTPFSFRLCTSRRLPPVLIDLTTLQKLLEPPPSALFIPPRLPDRTCALFGHMLALLEPLTFARFRAFPQDLLRTDLPGKPSVCSHQSVSWNVSTLDAPRFPVPSKSRFGTGPRNNWEKALAF